MDTERERDRKAEKETDRERHRETEKESSFLRVQLMAMQS